VREKVDDTNYFCYPCFQLLFNFSPWDSITSLLVFSSSDKMVFVEERSTVLFASINLKQALIAVLEALFCSKVSPAFLVLSKSDKRQTGASMA